MALGSSWHVGPGLGFYAANKIPGLGSFLGNPLLRAILDSLNGYRDGLWDCPKSGTFPLFSALVPLPPFYNTNPQGLLRPKLKADSYKLSG